MDINLGKVIILIGEISSGKSTLAKCLSEELQIPKASFGAHLEDYCVKNNLPEDKRKDLQNLGQKMIEDNPVRFLQNVISFSGPIPPVMIFEGVRHYSILKEIERISDLCIVIFIDATYQQRLSRYLSREKRIDSIKTEADFQTASSHPVEKEVQSLKANSSIIIRSSDSSDSDFRTLKNHVENWLSN